MKNMSHCAAAFALFATSAALHAAVIEKADMPNTVPLNSGAAWVGGVVPTADDVASFRSFAANRNFTLGEKLAWLGLRVTDDVNNGHYNFNPAANTLTLGAEGMWVLVNGGSNGPDYTFNTPLILATNQTWHVGRGKVNAVNGVTLNGYTLTLTGGMTKEFRNKIHGPGRVINTANNFILLNVNSLAPDADLVLQSSATLYLPENGVANQSQPFSHSLSLFDSATLNLHGSTTRHAILSNAGDLTVHPGGQSTIVISSKANYQTSFVSDRFVRTNDAGSVYIRGWRLGMYDPADGVANSVNVLFNNAPDLSGRGGAADTTTISIIPGVVVSTNGNANIDVCLATYDLVKGVRPLDWVTEYTETLADGEDDGNNVRIANVAGASSAVKTFTLTENTTVNSLSLATSGTGANGGIVLEAEENAALTIESGVMFTCQAVASPSANLTSMIDIRTPLDFNGQQGLVINSRTDNASDATGNGILRFFSPLANDGGKGVVFAGAGTTHVLNSEPHLFTGPLIISSGTVRFDGAADAVLTKLVLNGGMLQNRGNRIADNADIEINGGLLRQQSQNTNNGAGASETFNDLYMTGGSYNMGIGGTSSGSTTFSNAYLTGGTLVVTRGHNSNINGDIFLSGTASLIFNNSDNGDNRFGTLWMNNGTITITNSPVGFPSNTEYIPINIGHATADRNPARLVLRANEVPSIAFIGNPENPNTAIINSNAGVVNGRIELVGGQTFDIGDGPAVVDLRVTATIADHQANPFVSGALIKQGAGTLALSGENTYTGGTSVEAGRLLLEDGAIACAVEVSADAVFGGNGLVQNNVILEDNAGLAFSIESPLVVEGDIAANGTAGVALLDAIPETGNIFLLASAASIAGDFVLAPEHRARWHIAKTNTGLWLSKNTGSLLLIR